MGALEDYADKVSAKAKPEWRQPGHGDFLEDFRILSFDQSLSQTGWVFLKVWGGHRFCVEVFSLGTIRTSSDLNSHEGYFDQDDQLRQGLEAMHDELDIHRYGFPDAIVMERPSVFGNRTESSLLAANTVRVYARKWWTEPVLVSIQHSRTVLAGRKARDDKKAGHEALGQHYIPGSITRKWNEHMRDAAINALAHLRDLKIKEESA